MKKLLKITAGICLIAAVCVGIGTFRTQKAKEPEPEIIRPVRTVTLTGSGGESIRHYFGTVQGGKRVDLSFRVSGTLQKIPVEKGASVKKGELVAALDPRDFQTRLRQAQSAQSQAQAQYNNAQADFKRYENLYKQKVVPRATYDTYKTNMDVTRSAVNTAAAQTAAARDALKDTELRAPFNGVIADRMVENFQDITAKQAIFSLQDISTLEIVFNVPDNDILLAPLPSSINAGSIIKESANLFTMTAKFDAIPGRTFPLSLKEFATQADSRTNTYPVTVTLPQPKDVHVLPGMAVTVEVDFLGGKQQGAKDTKTEAQKNSYVVPATAILNEGTGENFLWRFENKNENENGEAHRVAVTVGGPRNDGSLEVSGPDLRGGDKIITAGVHYLHEGQRVRLMEGK